jgi:serine/threonine protein kinase
VSYNVIGSLIPSSQDIKGDNVVLSFEADGTVHAAKLIDWGLGRMSRSTPHAAPVAGGNADGQQLARQQDDVSTPNDALATPPLDALATPPLLDAHAEEVPAGMTAVEWAHSKTTAGYVRDQHAPELLVAGQHFTPASDLWAFGAMVLYEMLFSCCSALLDVARSAGPPLRMYTWRNRESQYFSHYFPKCPMDWNITSARLRVEFARNQPPPSPDDTLLFERLCEAFDSM